MKATYTITEIKPGMKDNKPYVLLSIAENIKVINNLAFPENVMTNVYTNDEQVIALNIGDKVELDITLNKYSRRGADGKYTNVQSFRINDITPAL